MTTILSWTDWFTVTRREYLCLQRRGAGIKDRERKRSSPPCFFFFFVGMSSATDKKDYRSYQTYKPCANKLLSKKWDEHSYQQHRRAVGCDLWVGQGGDGAASGWMDGWLNVLRYAFSVRICFVCMYMCVCVCVCVWCLCNVPACHECIQLDIHDINVDPGCGHGSVPECKFVYAYAGVCLFFAWEVTVCIVHVACMLSTFSMSCVCVIWRSS